MLGALAYLGEFELVDSVVEEFVEGECEGAFQGCGGAEACAEGNVTCEDGVESFHLAAALDGFPADAEDVAGPLLVRLVLFLEAELHVFVIVEREGAHLGRAVDLHFRHDTAVDGAGEHVTAVVVGVLTDQVDPAGRCEHRPFGTEQSLEFFLDLRLHSFHYVIHSQK